MDNHQKLSIGFIILIAALFFPAAKAGATPLLNPFNNHYYEAIPGSFDWHVADNLATSSNFHTIPGHLATVTSFDENQWIWNNLSQPNRYILGATDEAEEGVWRWSNAEVWVFSAWATGEPVDGFGAYPEDALTYGNDGQWNDLPIVADFWGDGNPYIFGYVVEYDTTNPVPEPATMVLVTMGIAGLFVSKRKKSSF